MSADQITVSGQVWTRHFLDDRSGDWFEAQGCFGQLVVETEPGGFAAFWWPPGIKDGEPVIIRKGYSSRRSAMQGAQNYIQRLAKCLGA